MKLLLAVSVITFSTVFVVSLGATCALALRGLNWALGETNV